jgi:ethanolamine utilization protein EutN
MHLGKVVGTVVATIKNPNLAGHRILLVQPMTWNRQADGELFAAIDLVSAGRGEWIYYVKSREAANALANRFNPSDRTILGIVDSIECSDPSSELPPGVTPRRGTATGEGH